jgi:nucleotide-binding universal stress UspA family protein
MPLPSDISRFIYSNIVDDYHREEGEKVLAVSTYSLSASSIINCFHFLFRGESRTILMNASTSDCSMNIMGEHGYGGVKALLVGLAITKVLHSTVVPILLVK